MKIADTIKDAYVSPCGLYRPWLSRTNPAARNPIYQRTALFVLNNPSTADDKVDDPTATRGWGFTESWSCNRMVFANTNSYRATDPRNRKPMSSPWSDYNDVCLKWLAQQASVIVCAWGDKANAVDAAHALRVLSGTKRPLHYLGTLTKARNPRHILYLKADLWPTVWHGF